MPFIVQRRRQCGAASLATVLRYRGVPVSASTLEPLLYTPGKRGTLALDIVAQARRHGFLVYPVEGSMATLLSEIAAGNPVLVLQNLGLNWLPQWHYAVAMGYDLERDQLVLRNGSDVRYSVALTAFFNTWRRAEFWGVVIMPPDQIPATAHASTYLRAASELEQNQPAAAAVAYQAALEYWPDDHRVDDLARLGLFNIAYQQQQYAAAAQWLQRGRGPQSPAHWNNLAYALAAMQCPRAALAAIRCAVHSEPDNPAYRASQSELREQLGSAPALSGTSTPDCTLPPCPALTGN